MFEHSRTQSRRSHRKVNSSSRCRELEMSHCIKRHLKQFTSLLEVLIIPPPFSVVDVCRFVPLQNKQRPKHTLESMEECRDSFGCGIHLLCIAVLMRELLSGHPT